MNINTNLKNATKKASTLNVKTSELFGVFATLTGVKGEKINDNRKNLRTKSKEN